MIRLTDEQWERIRDHFPAFIGMLEGRNFGKPLVDVGASG